MSSVNKPPGDDDANESTLQLNIPSLARRACDATIARSLASRCPITTDCLLSNTPWKLRFTSSNSNGSSSTIRTAESNNGDPYPFFSYLDLRRQQNDSWSTSRLEEGISLAKLGKSHEAEACYREGLDLSPSHTQLLVAYGALCANLGRRNEGIAKLKRALELDPETENAQKYLTVIEEQQQQQRERRNRDNTASTTKLTLRTDMAMRSAMAESAIQGQQQQQQNSTTVSDEKYPLLPEQEDGSSTEEEDRRARRRKRKKKKRRRHDSDDSSDEERRRKKRKKRRRAEESPRRRHDSS